MFLDGQVVENTLKQFLTCYQDDQEREKREKTKERQVQKRLHNGIRRRAGDRKIRGLSCVCELQLFGEVY